MIAGARKDDADRAFLLVIGQGKQKRLDGDLAAELTGRAVQFNDARAQRQVAIGRDDVDVVGLQRLLIPGLFYRHVRVPGQQRGHETFVPGIEVGDEHEGHAAVGRHGVQKRLVGVQAAGRGDQTDYRQDGRQDGFR